MTTTRKTSVASSATKPASTRTRTAPQKAATSKTAAAPKKVAPTAPQTVKPSSQPAATKVEKKAKPEKVKVVRDSFTIPKTEYARIADMKKRALGLGTEVKKSELIRAGLALLAGCSDVAFGKALAQVPTLKTGRPGKA
jgi:DNA-binding transcriptional regulator YiaG